MWLAIGKFFSSIVKFILGIVTAIIDWAREHPREAFIVALAVVALVASNVWTYRWSATKAHAKDAKTIATLRTSLGEANRQVDLANGETKKRDEKISRLEQESKTAADLADQELKRAQVEAQKILAEYDEKIKKERTKYETVIVKVPGYVKEIPVYIDKEGHVRCDRLSDTFMDQTNKLVDNVNSSLKKGAAK